MNTVRREPEGSRMRTKPYYLLGKAERGQIEMKSYYDFVM